MLRVCRDLSAEYMHVRCMAHWLLKFEKCKFTVLSYAGRLHVLFDLPKLYHPLLAERQSRMPSRTQQRHTYASHAVDTRAASS